MRANSIRLSCKNTSSIDLDATCLNQLFSGRLSDRQKPQFAIGGEGVAKLVRKLVDDAKAGCPGVTEVEKSVSGGEIEQLSSQALQKGSMWNHGFL